MFFAKVANQQNAAMAEGAFKACKPRATSQNRREYYCVTDLVASVSGGVGVGVGAATRAARGRRRRRRCLFGQLLLLRLRLEPQVIGRLRLRVGAAAADERRREPERVPFVVLVEFLAPSPEESLPESPREAPEGEPRERAGAPAPGWGGEEEDGSQRQARGAPAQLPVGAGLGEEVARDIIGGGRRRRGGGKVARVGAEAVAAAGLARQLQQVPERQHRRRNCRHGQGRPSRGARVELVGADGNASIEVRRFTRYLYR